MKTPTNKPSTLHKCLETLPEDLKHTTRGTPNRHHLDQGASVVTRDERGYAPLSMAKAHFEAVVNLLFDHRTSNEAQIKSRSEMRALDRQECGSGSGVYRAITRICPHQM